MQVCSEIVTLESGRGGIALPSLVAGLLLPDLPVFLHWRAEPDASRVVLARLWELATRVVVDSTAVPRALDSLDGLVQRQPDRSVTDLSWTKITGWREAVARAFDNAENAAALAELTHLEITHVGHERRAGAAARRLADEPHRALAGGHDRARGERRHARRLADARRARSATASATA